MMFPDIKSADELTDEIARLFIGAYGFEDRTLGWINYQSGRGHILSSAVPIHYNNPKGRNKIKQLYNALSDAGAINISKVNYDHNSPHIFHESLKNALISSFTSVEEIIVDISSMTKLAILVCLSTLREFSGAVRIVYSEADNYSPSEQEYKDSKEDMEMFARFPTVGVGTIIRMSCLSSIRMQGQPVTMIAFASFNEQLVAHMLGTINPHRLIFINRKSSREDYIWREKATQEIHMKLIDEYSSNNPMDGNGRLKRTASTLDYRDTIKEIDEIYKELGNYERIICAATGSKMQTVGLFFSKILHPDIHIEYPSPDSYCVKGVSTGIRKVYEIYVSKYSEFIQQLSQY